jgi:hypothetical protein
LGIAARVKAQNYFTDWRIAVGKRKVQTYFEGTKWALLSPGTKSLLVDVSEAHIGKQPLPTLYETRRDARKGKGNSPFWRSLQVVKVHVTISQEPPAPKKQEPVNR